jgi:ribosomal protein S18 acetylase RimI-like enzyme
MSTISIAEPVDIPALVLLINRAYRGEESRRGWTTETDLLAGDIRTNAENLASLMQPNTAAFLKCTEADDQIVGCVYLDKRGNRLYLGMFSVEPERQGAGIGKKLLFAAEEHALRHDCHTIFMQVISVRTELIEWYLRHGYRLTGERKPFDVDPLFGDPRSPLDFVFLEKMLTHV